MQFLRAGCRGEAVRLLQARLAARGCFPGAVDGDFGPKTDRAVRQFQAAHNLKVDGLVGDRTWAILLAVESHAGSPDVLAEERAELRALVPLDGLPSPRAATLEAALATLGWRERPEGSNGGPEVDRISLGYRWWDYAVGKPPWCALAVSFWLKEGLRATRWEDIPFGDRFGAVSQIEDWARNGGRAIRPRVSVPAEPGAIFTMSRGGSGSDPSEAVTAGHTGLVLADEGAFVRTIEGNTSNGVFSRRRRKSSLRYLHRWW